MNAAPSQTASGEPVVVASAVQFSYGRSRILTDLNLIVSPGAELAVTGRSGSGKSTLLLILAGLLAPAAGDVRWPGLDPGGAVRRGQIGLIFQAPSLVPELTATENVALPLRLRGASLDSAALATSEALEVVGLRDAGDALPAGLSGGMQQRVAIARVLAGSPRLVLADEPTGALDRDSALTVMTALRDRMLATGGALVVATHDDELASLLGQAASIDEGRLIMGVRA